MTRHATAEIDTIRIGSDLLLSSSRLKGARVGVVCNHASVDRGFLHIVDRLVSAPDVTLAAIFGPQHGFRSDVQDNMIETPHGSDSTRRVPVYSLYSETREPTAAMLAGLDALIIDLQDIGARIYTYIYTMANCLRACAKHRVPVIVCDRPNPINGTDVEGAPLVHGFESFVGQFPIPMRHGMTIGELARLFNEHFGLGAPLEIVKMEGWERDRYADATDLPWVMPSPNMPTLDTAVVYPGTVLFEGILISEGRGTTRPFELIGAPWINAEDFARRMNALELKGVHFRPAVFEPTFQKHAKHTCGGCQIHGGSRPTSTSTTRCRSTSSPDRKCCASKSKPAWTRATWPPAGSGMRKASENYASHSSCTDVQGSKFTVPGSCSGFTFTEPRTLNPER
jgi:uncharacterized protein YbbC (DUF1343 family)